MSDPVEEMLAAAAALAVSVADYDPEGVASVLNGLSKTDLQALAIALAANIDLDHPLTAEATPRRGVEVIDPAMRLSAQMFDTDIHSMLSVSRRRNVCDARAVAMYVCRLAGLSSTTTGVKFHRDHSTVLHAWGRVGEDHRLRGIAQRIAIQCGWTRDGMLEAS